VVRLFSLLSLFSFCRGFVTWLTLFFACFVAFFRWLFSFFLGGAILFDLLGLWVFHVERGIDFRVRLWYTLGVIRGCVGWWPWWLPDAPSVAVGRFSLCLTLSFCLTGGMFLCPRVLWRLPLCGTIVVGANAWRPNGHVLARIPSPSA
jgi:hypothetical protein